MGRYWLVFGGTGSVWGSTGWYLVVVGKYSLVVLWYYVGSRPRGLGLERVERVVLEQEIGCLAWVGR